MEHPATISLIVCTRNRASTLPAALSALIALQTAGQWEMIIVNNGSTDGTQSLLEAFRSTDPRHIKIVSEPAVGLSKAQNAGLLQATGSIIALSDDDCYPMPDYLERIRDCFQDTRISYLGGRVLLFDKNDAPVTIQTSEQRLEFPAGSYIRPGVIHGAAFAFRREVLNSIGGFDPDLGPGSFLGSGNDINVLVKCSAMGYIGVYDPRPTVRHHHRRQQQRDVVQLLKRYDFSRGAAFATGLYYPGTRLAYLGPSIRKIFSDILKLRFGALKRELIGAYRYYSILKSRK